MSTAEKREYYTAEAFLRFLEQSEYPFEYVDGYLRAMFAPTNRHNVVATNTLVAFANSLKGTKCRAFNPNSLVRIRRDSSTWFYYPDASIVCESNGPTDQFQDQPTVVVEVLSPSTRSIDLDEKADSYMSIGSLEMYLILEQAVPYAILYRRTPAGFVQDTVDGLDKSIAFPFLGFTIPMSDLYDGVDFTTMAVHEEEPLYETLFASSRNHEIRT